ncbi:MAG: SNF2-related protein [Anaerovoracaceae bacterium]|jgi:SNF2 family DNA or RNA helicase
MKYEPHEYQKYAIEYVKEHPVAAVFLSMGLGKSSIALTAIEDLMHDSFEIKKVLVIAPVRVAKFTWPDEIKKWDHLSNLSYAVAVGTPKQRMNAIKAGCDITIINRENVQWLIEKSGVPFDYDMVVIDELSSFKNHQSKRFRSLLKVRPRVKRIVGLTGTPAPNGLMDLWAEFRILDMGERLGKFIGQYRTRYFRPGLTNGQIVYSYIPLPGSEKAIYDRISDITISMKAEDHLKMPELISTEYPVFMDDAEVRAYMDMADEFLLPLGGTEITAANAGVLCGKLSQLANGAVYDDDGDTHLFHDRKLDALEDIIESANGKPLLIAYWFQHDRERIEERLKKLKLSFERLEKDDAIRRWNEGKIFIALIHPASAGHGLNLQSGGSTIVWFGLTWSLENYQQTIARLWRQGQTSETVVVMHIITAGTIDEQIVRALKSKNVTQAALINAVKAEMKIKDNQSQSEGS